MLIHLARAMTLPREIIPGSYYLLTRSCANRQFLMRPDEETNNAYTYCLAAAARHTGVVVVIPSAMSNHHHDVVHDPLGVLPAFAEYFHGLFAKCMNVLRGRTENFWSSDPVSYVRLEDPAAVLDKVVYAATNPVSAHLVEQVRDWPGVNGLEALLNGTPLVARRPKFFFRSKGRTMPATLTLQLTIPGELGERTKFVAEVKRRVIEVETRCAAERAASGIKVLGRKRVLQQSCTSVPKAPRPFGALSPTVATRNKWAHVESLLRRRGFQSSYKACRERWVAGERPTFPPGTYWLRLHADVVVLDAPTN